MIKEDFVSYKVARLLQEKGFNEVCFACYEYFISGVTMYSGWQFEYKGESVRNTDERVKCPTLQMAMKWLRNMGIVIEITTCWPSNPDFCMIPYCFRIEDYRKERDLTHEHGKYYTGYCSKAGMDDFLEENHLLFDELGFGEFPTYESTCEAAIKYCLTNLI